MAATLGANHPYKNEPPYFPAHAPEVLVSSEVKASVGNPWELKIEANNVATEFSAYDLPSWLQVDGQYLKGTPDAEGVFDITIAAGNANGSGVKKVKLTVTDFNNWPYSMDFTSKSLEPSSDNLVVHWKLDDESGTTAADSSGADPAVNGTATGGTVVNQVGKYGKAFKFDGVDDKVTHTLAANTTHAKYTVSIWAKPETVVQANYTGIFNSGNTGADFQLDIFDGEWRYAGDTAGSRILGSVTTDWTHIGITCDGTNTRMYLNGVLKHTIAKKDNVFQHYRLGANRAVSAHFKGLIDEVRIYNDALDSSIETLADVSLKNFPLLVRLRDGLNGFSYNQVKSLKGGDLRFLNTAGVELPYSIDVWNPDGESDIWVSVDQLRLQGGTKFTMYWGNPEATAVPPYATNGSAWSDFHLVTNLDETTHTNDISPNGYLGTGTSNVNQPTVGLIGGARTFTADNNSILFPGRPADADSISSSAWFYFTKVPGQDETFWYTRQWGVGDMRVYFHTNGKLRYEVHSGNPSAQYTAANPIVEDDLNKWTHLATVYDLVTKRYTFYKNGEINHTSTIGSPRNARISTGVVLGAHEWGNWREMRSANIDQFELHDAARSQAWFKASIESERAGSDPLTQAISMDHLNL